MTRIAVLGASGYLGGYAVRRLVADGREVVAVLRDPDRGDALPAGVTRVRGDITDRASLSAAFAGVDGVVVCVNGGADRERVRAVEEAGAANVAAAAEAAGVARIVLITGMFAQEAYADHHWEAAKASGEALLRAGTVPVTVLRVGFVLETLPRFVRRGRPVLIGAFPHPIRPVAADDLMSSVSRAFDLPGTAGRVYDVAGSDSVLVRDAVAAYAAAVTGRSFTSADVRTMPIRVMALLDRLFMGGRMERPLGILDSMGRYGDVTDTTAWVRDFGAPRTSFAEWLRARSAASEGVRS